LTQTQRCVSSIEWYQEIPTSLDDLPFLILLQLVAFLWASRSVHGRIQRKSASFWVSSIDMYRIVLPVNFDDGLSISVRRNKQLFENNGRQKFTCQNVQISYFSNPAIRKKQQILENVSLFLEWTTQLQIWHWVRSVFYLSTNTK
jgi:hypothetical protein